MKIKFKERTFEKFIDYEISLVAKSPAYSPDPVDEYYLGFDSGFCIPPFDVLWRQLAGHDPHLYMKWKEFQATRTSLSLHELDKLPEYITKPPPNYFMNLFLQYKRPDYLTRANAKEWSDYNNEPYFRYSLTVGQECPMHQHKALCALKEKAGLRAEVLYVAPAFSKIVDLVRYSGQRKLIDNSNFAPVELIEPTHRTITYQTARGGITKHSKSEKVSTEEIWKIIDALKQRSEDDGVETIQSLIEEREVMSFACHIKNIATSIDASLFSTDTEDPNRLAQSRFTCTRSEFLRLLGEKQPNQFEFEESRFSHALVTIFAYCETFNTDIYLVAK